jgi:Raf kinase inhibitor-like YbhB/YbcL family protein
LRRSKKPLIQTIALLPGIVLSYFLALPIEHAEAGPSDQKGKKEQKTMRIESSSFPNNGPIPARYTCDGHDISPELFWTDVPSETKSLVLIVDDPDAPDPAAPKRTWVHWVLYNIPPDTAGLAEGVETAALPPNSREGLNNWDRTGYGGPCPPIGNHRYFHKLYALDIVLPDLKHPGKAALEKAMQDHVIAHSELIGRYQKR